MSHPQALNKEQMEQLMADSIPAIAKRMQQDEGFAFLMKQADRIKDLETENARLKAELDKVDQQRRGNLVDAGSLFQENARLKAEVERLTDYLNKMNNTPPEGVDYVEVDVGFWTKHGSRLPSSYKAFWSNDKGWNAAKQGGQP